MLGSLFVDLYGFRKAMDILGIIVFSAMILFFVSCGGFSMLKPVKKIEDEEVVCTAGNL